MSTLEICDTFDPYYAGREPFFCARGVDPADVTKAAAGKARNGNETTAVEAGRPRPAPPRRPGR